MNVHYHQGKANVGADALSRMIMGIIAHIEDGKKELVKNIHRLAILDVRLFYSTSGCVLVHPSSESSVVFEVKEGLHLDHLLMVLKDSVWVKMNESFSWGDDGILRYQDMLCVQNVDDLHTRIITEADG